MKLAFLKLSLLLSPAWVNAHRRQIDSAYMLLQHGETDLHLAYPDIRAKDYAFNATIKTDCDPGIGSKAHGGELRVETKEGEGSTFIIQL